MPSLKIKDGDGTAKYISMESGDGASSAPLVPSQAVKVNAGTSGGWTPLVIIWPNDVTGQVAKASPGQVGSIGLCNSDTLGCWVNFYDQTGNPTIGVDMPVLEFWVAPASSFPLVINAAFTTGIALVVHGGNASDSTTAVPANKVGVNIFYA